MKWEVRGVDQRTGDSRWLVIEADDEKNALAESSRQGVLVQKLRLVRQGSSTSTLPVTASPLNVPPRFVSSLSCPSCGTADTRSVVMVYESGTIEGRATGAAIGAGGQMMFAGGRISSNTIAAKRCAPPPKKSMIEPTIGIVGPYIPCLFILGSEPSLQVILGCLAVATLIAGCFAMQLNSRAKYNRVDHAALMELWRRCWVCERCGQIFDSGR